MASGNPREKLIDFLERKAFEPVLKADPDRYDSEGQKRKLEDVQRATRSEQARYHDDYTSAEEVYRNFHSDLSSDAAQEVQRELRQLNLPTLADLEEEFDELAESLGVR